MTARRETEPTVRVPLRYPTAMIYVDESGSKASASRFFVIAALKIREAGRFGRAVRDVRDRTGFESEFKFERITRGSLVPYYELIDEVARSDAHIVACVVNRDLHDPFKGQPIWKVHASVTSQLLVGCINRRELVGVLMDGISTPRDYALDDVVRGMVNRRLKATSVVTAACLDSKASDGLQVADLLASAIAFERRRQAGHHGSPTSVTASAKAKVAARLMAAFDRSDFADCREGRVNIATFRSRDRSPKPPSGRIQSDGG